MPFAIAYRYVKMNNHRIRTSHKCDETQRAILDLIRDLITADNEPKKHLFFIILWIIYNTYTPAMTFFFAVISTTFFVNI